MLVEQLKRAARERGAFSDERGDNTVRVFCPKCHGRYRVPAMATNEELRERQDTHRRDPDCVREELYNRAKRAQWMLVHGRYADWIHSLKLPCCSWNDWGSGRRRYRVPQWIWAVTMLGQKQVTAGRRRRLLERLNNDPIARVEFEARLRLILDDSDPRDPTPGKPRWRSLIWLLGMIADRVGMTYPVHKILEAHS